MHPMIAILTPFQWLVTDLIFAVVSCKLNKVLPQLGQEIYSVLDMRVRVACNMVNAVALINASTLELEL
jgi:hypothetical protein